MKTQIVTVSALLLASSTVFAEDCKHERMINVELDLTDSQSLLVEAGAGSLAVTGEDTNTATVSGRACASDEDLLSELNILMESGDEARIETQIPETGDWKIWGKKYAYIDLEISVPADLALEVVDSSGSASLKNLASLNVTDSSGSLEIHQIRGDLNITDSSGGIGVRDVTGELHITDSSGSIDVERVEGDAYVDNDSSGGILLKDISGNAVVENDSSGNIAFESIGKSARVGNDSSGGISAVDIGGDFSVDSDGSGGINYENVGGDVSVPER